MLRFYQICMYFVCKFHIDYFYHEYGIHIQDITNTIFIFPKYTGCILVYNLLTLYGSQVYGFYLLYTIALSQVYGGVLWVRLYTLHLGDNYHLMRLSQVHDMSWIYTDTTVWFFTYSQLEGLLTSWLIVVFLPCMTSQWMWACCFGCQTVGDCSSFLQWHWICN